MATRYYVYAYIRNKDSKTAKAGTPYYIGKGCDDRAWRKHHFKIPDNKEQIIILESGLSEVGALAIERRLIEWWGRKDLGTGILINQTSGGEGTTGPKSESFKRNLSKALIGKPSPKSKYTKTSNWKPGSLGNKKSLKEREWQSVLSTGESNGNSKLSERDVIEIRELLSEGISCPEIAYWYDMSVPTIRAIKSKKLWKHI
jgi:hypothetical protein